MADHSAGVPATEWSDAALSCWGKTDPSAGDWLPLVRHLEDSAQVAALVWDWWLPDSVRVCITDGVPGDARDRGRRIFIWLAGSHDVGKASPAFAIKARRIPGFEGVVRAMDQHGLTMPPGTGLGANRPPTHGLVGHLFVAEWLEKTHGLSRRAARSLAVVVGGHHGIPPTSQELRAVRDDVMWTGFNNRAWRDVQHELLDGMAARAGVHGVLGQIAQPLSVEAQVLLTGALIVADWLASDSTRFPLGERELSVPDQARAAWQDLDIPVPWHALAPPSDIRVLIRARFPALSRARPRPMQEGVVRVAREVTAPPLILIEAAMGEGKTEAALAAAEVLAHRFGAGGVFVGLPTMATSDAMFDRVLAWAERLPGTNDLSTFLAHGKAMLNDRYRGLNSSGHIDAIHDDAGGSQRQSVARVSSWLTGRKKGVLADIVVGTIDQALFVALKTRHLALRHLAVAGKVVVIDEVHAADDYMQVYLRRALNWLGSYRTPVILLSATLPPAQRAGLISAYSVGRGDANPDVSVRDQAYPRITAYDGTLRELPVQRSGDVKVIHVERMDDDPECLIALVTAAIEAGACVAVVRDTVERAREAYDVLLRAIGPQRITLLHSRFLASHRSLKEADLRRKLGPPTDPAVRRPEGYVAVGTQVLEQSLDIDVDLMVTDIAPIDLVLQRSGRLHRHIRKRPEGYTAARLIITGIKDWSATPPTVVPGAGTVYGLSKVLRSLAVLSPHLDGLPIVQPSDLPRLVREAYDEELDAPEGWGEAWASAATCAENRRREQEDAATAFRLGGPDQAGSLVDWLDIDVAEENPKGRAQVRDGEDGIEVVVVQRTGQGFRTLPGPDGGDRLEISLDSTPSDAAARVLLGCVVRLPTWMCRGSYGDRVIDDLERQAGNLASWQESRWLAGELVLVLDEELAAKVADCQVHYDVDSGLHVERGGDEHRV